MRTRGLRLLLAFVAVGLLVGCASGYQQFYRPSNVPMDRLAAMRASPPPAQPIIERSRPDSGDRIVEAYAKRGYVMIGSSIFNSGRSEPDAAAVQQAKAVGADLVLIFSPTYTGSVTSAVPITTPTSTTSYSNGTATAYGPGGPVTAYGSGTTTTYGTQTTYVPITIRRSDYGAVYFIKQRFRLGVFFRALDDSERQRLQTNRGAVARLVVDDSPAFNADILVGDVFLAVDGQPVANPEGLTKLLSERDGRTVEFSILRGGARLQKTVTLTH
jgi:hypothetical protein